MRPFWITALLRITFVLSEVIEIPNMAMYHVTPKTEVHMRFLNKLRTSNSGMMFIHGVGAIGETVGVLASPSVLEIYGKDLNDMKLHFDMEFNPVTIEMQNEIVKKVPEHSALKAVAAAEQNKSAEQFLPIEPMAAPDVFSGIFLKLSPLNKGLEVDFLSYGGKVNSTMGNPYLCLAVKKSVDDTAISKQWIFEKTEQKGYYVLRNRKLPQGYVTWEDDEDQYLVIETRMEFQRLYRKGGPLRKNVYFKVTRAKGIGTQIAYNVGIRGMDNEDTHVVMEPVWKESTGCYVLRRTFREASMDGEKLESLFSIEKANTALKIVGRIENFKYKENVNDLYVRAEKEKTVEALTSRHIFNHGHYPLKLHIDDAHERRDKFRLKFEDDNSMSLFDELKVLPGLDIGTTMSLNDTEKPSMIKLAAVGRDTVEKFKYRITGALQVPAWSSVQYTVIFGWLERFTIDFEATLQIVGRGDRMTFSDKPKVVLDQILNFGYVYDALIQRGFKMQQRSNDPRSASGIIPIKGTIFARTMGVKGDVEMTVKKLSQNISTTCHRK